MTSPTGPLKRFLLCIFLFAGTLQRVTGQTLFSRWQYEWGGDRQESMANIIPLAGNRYLFGGTSASNPNTCTKSAPLYGGDDFAIFVLDDNGNKVMEKTYGGSLDDYLYDVKKVPAGGYILVGETESPPSGIKTSPAYGNGDIWVVRIDDDGNLLWENTFGTMDYEGGIKVLPTPDGGFLVAGASTSSIVPNNNYGKFDYNVIKVDANGNLVWKKNYGGSWNDYLQDMVPTANGNYLLSGYSNSPADGNKTAPLRGASDIWVVCIRGDGSIVWDQSYNTGGSDYGGTLLALNDGNYLVTGFRDGGGGYFVGGGTGVIRKIDPQGNQLWVQTCVGAGIYNMSTQAPDGTIYVAGGTSGNNLPCKTSPFVGGGAADIWIAIYDPSGNKIGDLDYGGNDVDLVTDIKVINGDVLVASWTDSYLSGNKTVQRCGQTADGWVLRLTRKLYVNGSTPPALCVNSTTFQVYFTAYDVYQPGNVFTAQLSDANGSFASPYNIGSWAGVQSGSITATLPAGLPPGDGYKIRVISSLPADNTFGYSVAIQGLPTVALGNDVTICSNTSLILRTGYQSPGTQYLWSDGSTSSSLVVSAAGTYSCQVQNSCGSVDGSIHIATKPLAVADIGGDVQFCEGHPVVLQSSPEPPDVTYHWSNGDVTPSIAVSAPGTYWLQTTNSCGTTGDTIQVTMNPDPVSRLDKDTVLCEGVVRRLDPGAGFTYLWNDGETGETITVSRPGEYRVQITDGNGCVTLDTAVIKRMAASPAGFLPADTSLCSWQDMILKPDAGFKKYEWSTGDTGPSIDVSHPGIYWLSVTDRYGCTGTDSIVIGGKECPYGFFMPSAFSPNHDGKNDRCKPMLFGRIGKYHFMIFDRWGQKVFETEDPSRGWDGNLNGNPANAGTYVWVCSYQLASEPEQMARGTVVLIR